MGLTEVAAIIAILAGSCALIAYGHDFYHWIRRQWRDDDPPAA